ncbi:hypothetical protein L7U65_26740, partial [Klebsiella pneumoniae]|uniref:hypothetical protein n=1 Tax=Klebsiella pneumoniae TaxID=573 RepID=UPI002238F380
IDLMNFESYKLEKLENNLSNKIKISDLKLMLGKQLVHLLPLFSAKVVATTPRLQSGVGNENYNFIL